MYKQTYIITVTLQTPNHPMFVFMIKKIYIPQITKQPTLNTNLDKLKH